MSEAYSFIKLRPGSHCVLISKDFQLFHKINSPLLFKPFAHATVGQHMQALLKLYWQLTGLPYVRTCCLGDMESSQDWSALKAGAESFSVYWKLSLFSLFSFSFQSATILLAVDNWGAGGWRQGNLFQHNIRQKGCLDGWLAVSWIAKASWLSERGG